MNLLFAWRIAPLLSLVGFLAILPSTVSAQGVNPTAWQKCRSIPDAAARLACYDALPLAPGVSAAPPLPRAGTTAAGAAAAGAAVPGTADAAQAAFGREDTAAGRVDAITSSLPGAFEGWGSRQLFRLANGQVWQLIETGTAYYPTRQNPGVTVRRAALGSFLMTIEGVSHVLRVRRVE